jgi:hypothetical protein
MDASGREVLLQSVGRVVADRLVVINQAEPITARFNVGTAVAVVADILDQAQQKKRAKDVAEYLVGAKIDLRFGPGTVQPKNVNTPNRDEPADYRVGAAAIEVTVSPPDRRHVGQVRRILGDTSLDVWLLVRLKDCQRWRKLVAEAIEQPLLGRVAVTAIETFVGQNISEIGQFDPPDVIKALKDLFVIYNERWLPNAGSGGLRIVPAERAGRSD